MVKTVTENKTLFLNPNKNNYIVMYYRFITYIYLSIYIYWETTFGDVNVKFTWV